MVALITNSIGAEHAPLAESPWADNLRELSLTEVSALIYI